MIILEILQPSIHKQVNVLLEETSNKFTVEQLNTVVEGSEELSAIDADDYIAMLMKGQF